MNLNARQKWVVFNVKKVYNITSEIVPFQDNVLGQKKICTTKKNVKSF